MNPDFDRLRDLAAELCPDALFVTVSGAHLYGFPSADSDVDLRGAFLAPLDAVLGLDPVQETHERAVDLAGVPVELVAHELRKYLHLMRKHNGYILEQVFSPLVVTGREFLDRLRPLAARCATVGCHHHYRGFYQSRFKLLEAAPEKKAKHLLYAYRVLLTGIHLLRTGAVEPNLVVLNETFRLPYVPELIARKAAQETGGLPDLDWQWHRAELERLAGELDRARDESRLPAEPPERGLHDFLVAVRRGG